MIREQKIFTTDFNTEPDYEDVLKCVEIARENDCVVKLEWRMKWSGEYVRYIYPETDPNVLYKTIKDIIYGL